MFQFMKNKILFPLAILGVIAAFLSVRYITRNQQSSEEKRTIAIETAVKTIESLHFAPRPINDSFSDAVYKKIFADMDPDKLFFTENEMKTLRRYEFKIDDEIRMGSIEFFDSLDDMYQRSMANAEKIYPVVLDQPFTFESNETLNTNPDDQTYAADQDQLTKKWRAYLKYRVLSKYVDLKTEQDKKKDNKDSVNAVLKTDSELEAQAREDVRKSYQRWFKNMHKVKDDDRFTMYVNAITTCEDPHTEYFPPEEKKGFDEMMSGSFFGIGAQLKPENDKTTVSAIITGSPSWKQGELKAGDVITKVAQGEATPVDISGYELTDVVKLIRGPKGTEVRLTVKRPDGSIKVIPIIRGVVQIEDKFAKSAIIKGKDGNIGYVYLPEFYADFNHTSGRRCAVDVENEVKKLKDEGVSGIIIDLRYNSGGSLGDVVDMAGVFIGRNTVVQVKGNHAAPSQLRASGNDTALYSGPMAVMINEGSASASEILAAAMQDYKRAVIVGATSWGKGSVQKMVSLDDMLDPMTRLQMQSDTSSADGQYIGSLKITMEKFYRVNGGSTQLKGVTPDITLPDVYEFEDDDMGERHNKAALKWDEIPAAAYTPVNKVGNIEQLKELSSSRVRNNPAFHLMEENAALVKKRRDEHIVSLNEQQFRKEQDEATAMSKKLEDVQKSTEKMDLINARADLERINLDSASIAKNKDWLTNLSKDIYIAETVNIINDLSHQGMKVSRRKSSN